MKFCIVTSSVWRHDSFVSTPRTDMPLVCCNTAKCGLIMFALGDSKEPEYIWNWRSLTSVRDSGLGSRPVQTLLHDLEIARIMGFREVLSLPLSEERFTWVVSGSRTGSMFLPELSSGIKFYPVLARPRSVVGEGPDRTLVRILTVERGKAVCLFQTFLENQVPSSALGAGQLLHMTPKPVPQRVPSGFSFQKVGTFGSRSRFTFVLFRPTT